MRDHRLAVRSTTLVNFPPPFSFPPCAFPPIGAINNEPRECGWLGVICASLVRVRHLIGKRIDSSIAPATGLDSETVGF